MRREFLALVSCAALVSASQASLPRDVFRTSEARPLQNSYESLLKGEAGLQPKPNEALEDRVRRFQRMAEQGDPVGQFGLAMLYKMGFGLPKNPNESAAWCRKAAEAGLPAAQTCFGEMLDIGIGVSRDPAEAVAWYERAASKGFAPAKVDLGLSLTWGTGTATNFARALKLFREADQAGYAPGAYQIAIAYVRGRGVETNQAEALKWFVRASDLGLPEAFGAVSHSITTRVGMTGRLHNLPDEGQSCVIP